MKKCFREIKAKVQGMLMTAGIWWMMAVTEADAIEKTKMVTGTKKLLKDLQNTFIGIEAAVCIAVFVWQLIRRQAASEEEKPKYEKAAKGTVIVGIIIMCATSIIPTIFGYYK